MKHYAVVLKIAALFAFAAALFACDQAGQKEAPKADAKNVTSQPIPIANALTPPTQGKMLARPLPAVNCEETFKKYSASFASIKNGEAIQPGYPMLMGVSNANSVYMASFNYNGSRLCPTEEMTVDAWNIDAFGERFSDIKPSKERPECSPVGFAWKAADGVWALSYLSQAASRNACPKLKLLLAGKSSDKQEPTALPVTLCQIAEENPKCASGDKLDKVILSPNLIAWATDADKYEFHAPTDAEIIGIESDKNVKAIKAKSEFDETLAKIKTKRAPTAVEITVEKAVTYERLIAFIDALKEKLPTVKDVFVVPTKK